MQEDNILKAQFVGDLNKLDLQRFSWDVAPPLLSVQKHQSGFTAVQPGPFSNQINQHLKGFIREKQSKSGFNSSTQCSR